MTDPIKTMATSTGNVLIPERNLLLADRTGAILGSYPVPIQQQTNEIRQLTLPVMLNYTAAAGVAALFTLLAIVDQFDEMKVNHSIQSWQSASRHLGALASDLPEIIASTLPAQDWTAADRDEFTKFVNHFTSEVTAVAAACITNAEALEKIRSAFHDAIATLRTEILVVLVPLYASTAALYFPATAMFAREVGAACSTRITAIVVTILGALAVAIAVTVGWLCRAGEAGRFTTESQATDATRDRDLKEITINWVHDASYYKQATR